MLSALFYSFQGVGITGRYSNLKCVFSEDPNVSISLSWTCDIKSKGRSEVGNKTQTHESYFRLAVNAAPSSS